MMVLSAGLAGCLGEKDDHTNSFRYNLPNQVTSLDPAFAKNRDNIWLVDHLYNTLVQFDDDMNIVPDLAKSWDVSSDGMEYTFHLRQDVYFHHNEVTGDTRKLKASDVAYSLNRLLDPVVSSPGSWILKGNVSEQDPFQVINDSTIIIKLEKPFPPMLGILTMQYCSVVCPEVVEHYKDRFRRNAVGTGPFELVNWRENQGIFLNRNQRYHFQLPSNIQQVRVSFISDRKTALLDLLSGNLDLLVGMDPSYKAILFDEKGSIQPRHNQAVSMLKSPFLNTEYLGINLEKAKKLGSPLANKNFRKALNYAMDKDLMMISLRGGVGVPGNSGFLPKGTTTYNELRNGYPYNLDSARYYLELSGEEPDVEPLVLKTNGDYLDLCLYAANQWGKLGIDVEVELIESSLLRQQMRSGDAEFFRASWIGDYPDSETFLTVFYGKNPAPPNYTRFVNSEYDSLYEVAMSLEDEVEREMTYVMMDEMLIEEAPVIFLFYDESLMLTSPRVRGLSRNGFNLLRLDSVKVE